ncbi:MAG: thermonuclease family protein [Candidatus Helarchaeota archaeon]
MSTISSYKQDYFTGVDVRVFFGDIWIDDIVMITYQYAEAKAPLFGYASQYFDAIIPGTRIVQGQFAINFKEQGYLPKAIELAMEKKLAHKNIIIDNNEYPIEKYWYDYLSNINLDIIQKAIDQDKKLFGIYPLKNVEFPLRPDEMDYINAYDLIYIYPRITRGFDIIIRYFKNNKPVELETLYNCHITTNGQSINIETDNGSVVVEAYNFFAQSINYEIYNNPMEPEWINQIVDIDFNGSTIRSSVPLSDYFDRPTVNINENPLDVPARGDSVWNPGDEFTIGKFNIDYEIIDADTIFWKDKNIRIRFAGLNAPERSNQPKTSGGSLATEFEAREFLKTLICWDDIELSGVFEQVDQYGRIIAWIKINGIIDTTKENSYTHKQLSTDYGFPKNENLSMSDYNLSYWLAAISYRYYKQYYWVQYLKQAAYGEMVDGSTVRPRFEKLKEITRLGHNLNINNWIN